MVACRAYGLRPIDGPFGDFNDPDGYLAAAGSMAALGMEGKWAIHPDQLETINQVFSPSPEDIERAITILEAAQVAKEQRRGAIAVEGRMVDQATVRLAQRLYDQARHLGLVAAQQEYEGKEGA